MAKSSAYYFVCTSEEAFKLLETVPIPLHGVIITFPPTSYTAFSIPNLTCVVAESPRKVLIRILVRTAPIDLSHDFKAYDEGSIAFGFLQIDFPAIYKTGYEHGVIAIGLDEPHEGIESPKRLYREFKRLINKACKHRSQIPGVPRSAVSSEAGSILALSYSRK
jgi:hypothetical protein